MRRSATRRACWPLHRSRPAVWVVLFSVRQAPRLYSEAMVYVRRTVTLLIVAGVVACSSHKKGEDKDDASVVGSLSGPDAASTASADPAPAPIAANEESVTRFPDEQALANAAATVQRPTNLREIPRIGKVVASLSRGTSVTKIAQHDSSALVIYEDAQARKLLGWIGQDAFSPVGNAVAQSPKAPTCKAPEIPLMGDAPFCGRVCTADAGCRTGEACKGVATKLVNGKAGDAVTVCAVFNPPAPRPTASSRIAVAPVPSVPLAATASSSPPPPEPPPPPPPTPAPSTFVEECPEFKPKPPGSNCVTFPLQDRPNGMQCINPITCASRRCNKNAKGEGFCIDSQARLDRADGARCDTFRDSKSQCCKRVGRPSDLKHVCDTCSEQERDDQKLPTSHRPDGMKCGFDNQCSSDRCENRVCSPATGVGKPNGATCGRDRDCASNNCRAVGGGSLSQVCKP